VVQSDNATEPYVNQRVLLRLRLRPGLGVDVEVILMPLCICCI
jgi:hypothetical protein